MSVDTAQPGDRVTAWLRTTVPALWGSLVAWLLGVVVLPDAVAEALTSEAVVAAVLALAIGAWYALWRWLEPRLPAWVVRLVLGSARSPRYVEHDPPLTAAQLEAARASSIAWHDVELEQDRAREAGPDA